MWKTFSCTDLIMLLRGMIDEADGCGTMSCYMKYKLNWFPVTKNLSVHPSMKFAWTESFKVPHCDTASHAISFTMLTFQWILFSFHIYIKVTHIYIKHVCLLCRPCCLRWVVALPHSHTGLVNFREAIFHSPEKSNMYMFVWQTIPNSPACRLENFRWAFYHSHAILLVTRPAVW